MTNILTMIMIMMIMMMLITMMMLVLQTPTPPGFPADVSKQAALYPVIPEK